MQTTYRNLFLAALAWALENRPNTRRKGWLDKAASDCAAATNLPRCWALINGIEAAARYQGPRVTSYAMGGK